VRQWEVFLCGTELRVAWLHLIAVLLLEGNRGHKNPHHFALLWFDKTVVPLPPPVPECPLPFLGSRRAPLRARQAPFLPSWPDSCTTGTFCSLGACGLGMVPLSAAGTTSCPVLLLLGTAVASRQQVWRTSEY